jgi:hypothetical protein
MSKLRKAEWIAYDAMKPIQIKLPDDRMVARWVKYMGRYRLAWRPLGWRSGPLLRALARRTVHDEDGIKLRWQHRAFRDLLWQKNPSPYFGKMVFEWPSGTWETDWFNEDDDE